MAEDALKDEDEWTIDDEEVSNAQSDLEEMMNILKELDMESKNKNSEKPPAKKKLS